jgi:hypothetical protein
MAYITPTTFIFQKAIKNSDSGNPNDVSRAEIAALFSNVTELHTVHVVTWNRSSNGVPFAQGEGQPDYNALIFEHFRQWLYYKSQSEERTGVIRSYNTELSEEDVTLPYAADGAKYDLDSTLNWMVPGRLYLVEHVEFAFEVDH